jgi:MFS family permease
MGLSSFASAGLVSGFNLASALGRISFGQLSDIIGPVNSLILAMGLNGIGMLLVWPLSTEIAPLVVFVIIAGMSAGKLFRVAQLLFAHHRRLLFSHASNGGVIDRSLNNGFELWAFSNGVGSRISARCTHRRLHFAGVWGT